MPEVSVEMHVREKRVVEIRKKVLERREMHVSGLSLTIIWYVESSDNIGYIAEWE